MTVYLDVVFIENLIMNLVIVLSEAVVLNSFKKFFRKFLSSFLLSTFYIITLFYPMVSSFQILAGVLAILVAFNPHSVKQLLKQTILFYFISFLFGGISFAMLNCLNGGKVTILDGVLIGDFSVFKVFLCGILGAFLVYVFLKKKKQHVFKNIVIGLDGKEVKLRVLLDTGNLLREPYTDKPVIIVEKDALKEVLGGEIIANFQDLISR